MINHYIPTSMCLAKIKIQLILLFSLFLLLFMNPTTLFGTIHISLTVQFQLTFTLYTVLSKKVFNFSKINGF